MVGNFVEEQNLLPYSVYKQLGLGELKPTNITLSLADSSVKIPKGIVEDVLVKVEKFYYPVVFIVLDTEPIASGPNHVPIILERPFLATANAIINCRNGVMQLTFGNMTLELNIFHLSHKHKPVEGDKEESDEVCSIDQDAGKPKVHKLQELANQDEAVDWELSSVTTEAAAQNHLVRRKSTKMDQARRLQHKPLSGLRSSSSLTLHE